MTLGISILSLYATVLACSVLGAKDAHPDYENILDMNKKENILFACYAVALLACAVLILIKLCAIL